MEKVRIRVQGSLAYSLAEEISQTTGLQITDEDLQPPYLLVDEWGVHFVPQDEHFQPLTWDLVSMMEGQDSRIFRPKNDLLYRAVGLKKENLRCIVDATAGMGWDGLSLWSLNRWSEELIEVHSVERDPVIYSLLYGAVQRLRRHGHNCEGWYIHFAQGQDFLEKQALNQRLDVVFMDPMFPEKKKKALPRKEMQVFRQLVGEDGDIQELLNKALQVSSSRVVVKRPVKAPLPEVEVPIESVYSLSGKLIRYDVFRTQSSNH